MFRGHLAVQPIAIPAACPLVPHSGSKLCLPSIVTGVKGDTAKLCNKGSLTSLKMNLLVLIVQLIVLSEDIGSWTAPTGSGTLDKLTDLNDSIGHQMVQLQSKFAHDVHKDRMWWHTKPGSEKVFKNDSFVCPRLWHGLHAGRSAISLVEIASVTFHQPGAGFRNM
jgi:hypothetical protein